MRPSAPIRWCTSSRSALVRKPFRSSATRPSRPRRRLPPAEGRRRHLRLRGGTTLPLRHRRFLPELHYMLDALDGTHGNARRPADLWRGPSACNPNHPNPFNPSTQIRFSLAPRGPRLAQDLRRGGPPRADPRRRHPRRDGVHRDLGRPGRHRRRRRGRRLPLRPEAAETSPHQADGSCEVDREGTVRGRSVIKGRRFRHVEPISILVVVVVTGNGYREVLAVSAGNSDDGDSSGRPLRHPAQSRCSGRGSGPRRHSRRAARSARKGARQSEVQALYLPFPQDHPDGRSRIGSRIGSLPRSRPPLAPAAQSRAW